MEASNPEGVLPMIPLLLSSAGTAVLPSEYSFALLRWLLFYAGMLAVWAITSTRATLASRRAFGRSKFVRWISAVVGLVVFVLIPAFVPRLLVASAALLAIAPVLLAIFRLYRQGTGLAAAVREGTKQTVGLGFGMSLHFVTTISRFLWMILSAIVRFDWATLKTIPDLYVRATERLQQVVSPGSINTFEILQPSGLPIKRDSDPRLKGLPDSVLPKTKTLLQQASRLRAAEAVLTLPSQGLCEVAYKIDGTLQKGPVLGRDEGDFVFRALHTIAGLSFSAESSQSGLLPIMCDGERSDIIVDSTRSHAGRKLALRFTRLDRVLFEGGLGGLGLDDKLLAALQKTLQRRSGLVLLSGRPDSGKSVTMYAALMELAAHGRSIVTAERSFRQNLEGRDIQQVIAGTSNAADLVTAIRMATGHKTEVLAVRDIVDRVEAEHCLRAAVAGQLVLAILPADDSLAALERLVSLGVDRGLIRSALVAIISQRLVRPLCEECKTPYAPTPELLTKLGLRMSGTLTFQRHGGCKHCRGTGFVGRTAIFEMFTMNENVSALLASDTSSPQAHEVLRGALMRSLRQSAVAKIVHGITSVEEAARILK